MLSPLLFSHLNKYIGITESEYAEIEKVLVKRFIKKKKDLVSEGNISRYIYFVDKGSLRSYTVDKEGTEHVVQLAIEEHWIADLSSFITQSPGNINIEAIKDSEVLQLPHNELELLYERIPALERFFRQLIQRAYVGLQHRLNLAQSSSAEERYREFIKTQPHYNSRIPLNYIASYLGITPESLSRIRKQMYNK